MLPLLEALVDKPQAPSQVDNNQLTASPATLPATLPSPYCPLCSPLLSTETWSAKKPETPEDEARWISVLETTVHLSCLNQAKAERKIISIEFLERNNDESETEFASRVLENKKPMVCTIDSKKLDVTVVPELKGGMEVEIMAQHPFSTGFRLFPQLAPPRKLDDLILCTSKLNQNGRMSESSIPLNIPEMFPELNKYLRTTISDFMLPGGPVDILWKSERNRTRSSNFKLIICSPGSTRHFRQSRYRLCDFMLTQNSEIEWASISSEDAERLLDISAELRSSDDPSWIPNLAFCLRNGAVVHSGTQTKFGQTMISSPGCASWSFVRGNSSTSVVEWSFAERSKAAFSYALSLKFKPEFEVDEPDWTQDILNCQFIKMLLEDEEERNKLLPKELVILLLEKLDFLSQSVSEEQLDFQEIERKSEGLLEASYNRERCDFCRTELFDRFIFCSQCENEGFDPNEIIDLQASHPPRSKKDRSILPDWLRVGCRVLVNLTVSGNSNDRPPRVIGASHLPGVLLKTGHGFFTVYLEGAGETVVKRRAALDPHPYGSGIARGFKVTIRADGTGEHFQTATCAFKTCIYCINCYSSAKVHKLRQHDKKNVTLFSSRESLLDKFKTWKEEVLTREEKPIELVWSSNPSYRPEHEIEELPISPPEVVEDQLQQPVPIPAMKVRPQRLIKSVSVEAGSGL